jgi:hypothetical protein
MGNIQEDETPRNKKIGSAISNLTNVIAEDFKYSTHTKQWIHWNGNYWENGEQTFSDIFDKEVEKQSIDYDVDKRSINRSLREKLKLSQTDIDSELLLVTPNGTIDIRQLKYCTLNNLRPADGERPQWFRPSEEFKTHFITMCTNAVYKWKSKKDPVIYKKTVLEDLANDSELYEFYNLIDASLLLGGLYHEYFYVYWGPGRNGKTILLDVKREMLGSYSSTLSPYAFRLRKTDAIKEVYSQKEKRLVIIDELNRSTKLDTSIIKRITGRNHFQPNHPDKENDFTVAFKCIFDTNHLPNVGKEESTGFWERVIIFPFRDVLPKEKRKKNLLDDIKRKELDDIFTYLVDVYLPEYLRCVSLLPSRAKPVKSISTKQEYFIDADPKDQTKKKVFALGQLIVPDKITKAIDYYRFAIDPYSVFIKEACLEFEPNFIQSFGISRVGMRESFTIFIHFVKHQLHRYMELFSWGDETESLYFADIHCSERQFFHSMEQSGFYTSIINGTNSWRNLYIRQSVIYPNSKNAYKIDDSYIAGEKLASINNYLSLEQKNEFFLNIIAESEVKEKTQNKEDLVKPGEKENTPTATSRVIIHWPTSSPEERSDSANTGESTTDHGLHISNENPKQGLSDKSSTIEQTTNTNGTGAIQPSDITNQQLSTSEIEEKEHEEKDIINLGSSTNYDKNETTIDANNDQPKYHIVAIYNGSERIDTDPANDHVNISSQDKNNQNKNNDAHNTENSLSNSSDKSTPLQHNDK